MQGKRNLQGPKFVILFKRESTFSLKSQAIGPSKFVGIRKKAALHIKAYEWAPVLGVFDKLREVGDLSYLGFTLYLSVL